MTVSNTGRMKLIYFFGNANNYVIGEKINLGKKFKHRTITHFFFKCVYFQKLNPTQTTVWISKKKNQNARCVSPMVRWLGGSTRLAGTYMQYMDDISVINRHLYNILFTI